jgi:S-sulfosulfanyl-L-cysteine sulfohydrolase
MNKREFLQMLGAAAAASLPLARYADADARAASKGLYDLPPFGNVSFLHMTDCHAQLKPVYFREPGVNLGVGSMNGQWPHLVGDKFLKAAKINAGSDLAHAFTCLDFEKAARGRCCSTAATPGKARRRRCGRTRRTWSRPRSRSASTS